MNIKKTVKKMTAVLTGATMIGATVMGAMAMDLGNFPAPIVQDGEWDGRIVIGANAGSTLDVAGATEIGAKLPELGKVPVSIGGGVITVEGAYDFENLALDAAFPADVASLDENDLETLKDYVISWDDEDVDVSERVVLANGALEVVTSGVNGKYEEYGVNAYLNVPSALGSIAYKVVFEDNVNASMVTSDDETKLELEFLGKDIVVTAIDAASMTLETSASTILEQDETWTVDGKTLEVVSIYENGVLLEVEGVRKSVSIGGSEVDVNGLDVTLEEHVWIEMGHEYNFVELKAGEDLKRTIDIGDSLYEFGEPEDRADAEWIWDWTVNGDMVESIGATNNLLRELTEDEVEYSDERSALAVGETMFLPNNHVGITFDGYYDTTSSSLDLSFREMKLENSTEDFTDRDNFLVITSDSDRSPFTFDGISADSIYIAESNGTAFKLGYEDDGERVWYNDGNTTLLTDDVVVSLARGQEDVVISSSAVGNVTIAFGDDVLEFALANDYTEFDEEGHSGVLDTEHGVKLSYGVTFTDSEKMIEDNRFVMDVPHEKAEPIVYVSGKDSAVVSGSAGDAYRYPVAPESVMLLDTDALSKIGSIPMIVVGGPNANTVAAELLGVSQGSEDVLDLFSPNKAMIRLFEDENAILVAGYEAKDTYAASLALANFHNNKESFEGQTEVELTIPASTVTSIVGAN